MQCTTTLGVKMTSKIHDFKATQDPTTCPSSNSEFWVPATINPTQLQFNFVDTFDLILQDEQILSMNTT